MRVLVTGASGFIGGYVVDNLLAQGHVPVLLDRLDNYTDGHAINRFDPDSDPDVPDAEIEFRLGDIRDYTAVTEAISTCDRVIHVAGVLGTSETIDNPLPAVETNIVGGLNVFQGMRQHDVPGCYVTVGNYWMNNSYSITKTTAERFAWMFNREHGTKIAVVRALNAYGPRQKAEPVRKIMPNFCLPALRGEAITIYGDGEQIMDMIHVADVADVLVRAAIRTDLDHYVFDPDRDVDAPVKYEAGSGRPTTVNDIARIVLEAAGREVIEGQTVEHVPMRGGEPEHSVVLGSPATLEPLYPEGLNLVGLEEGVEETLAYYADLR